MSKRVHRKYRSKPSTLRSKRGRYVSPETAISRRLGVIVVLLVVLWHVRDMNAEYISNHLEPLALHAMELEVKAGELERSLAASQLVDNADWSKKVEVSKKVNLYDFFAKYSPDSDNNNSREYARAVAENMNIDPNMPVEALQSRIPEFAKQIAIYEGYYANKTTIAMTHNNPGNLKYIGQKGSVKGKYGFAKFKHEQDGWSALHRQIARDIVREKN